MKNVLFWFLAVLITVGAAFYQRISGPTYPKNVEININENITKEKLPRSFGGEEDCPIKLNIAGIDSAKVFYKRYPSKDDWKHKAFNLKKDTIFAKLPSQPPAGKLVYYFKLFKAGEKVFSTENEPVIIRFKGEVPNYVLIPHILFMFFAMLFSNLTGIYAIAKRKQYRLYGFITFFLILAGGMILGPVVQKFAFNEYWAGVPFGWDLTDNKTLIAFVFWIFAVVANYRKNRPWAFIIAAIVTIIIFSIPHSMFGSEFDYASGEIVQG